MSFVACRLVPLIAAAFLFCQSQSADLTQCPTFANWDVSKNGPLLVLEPDKVKTKTGTSLPDFKRKLVQIGGLHAIVPETMVIIDESGMAKPDLYDGLPMYAKVMYLLSILDANQFKKLCKDGIGFSDLRDEQVRVFESILPKPFKWTSTANSGQNPATSKYTLSDNDRSKVRFRVNRTLNYKLFTADDRGYSEISANQQPIEGQTEKRRDDTIEFDPSESFGVEARKTVPNKLKAADLDYESPSLEKTIQLMPSEKVIDILKRIEQATGREFFADIRVANRVVVAKGAKAQIADVLKALAQTVTGTYRKVGRMYLLTSDLTGMGARAMRFYIWNENLTQYTFTQVASWHKAIIAAGNMKLSSYDASDPLAPNDLMNRSIANQNDRKPSQGPDINVADLPKIHQTALEHIFNSYGNEWRRDKVSVDSAFSYGFVLPDGSRLMPERQSILFSEADLTPPTEEQEPPVEPRTVPKVNLSESTRQYPLAIRVLNPADVKRCLDAASAYGFKEVWLETRSAEALRSAVDTAKKLAMNLRLVVQPFNQYDDVKSLPEDLTILGDNGDQARERTNSIISQPRLDQKVSDKQSHRVLTQTQFANAAWRSRFIDLAKTDGLSGIVVLGTRPFGYQKLGGPGEPVSRQVVCWLGYSLADREASIRSKQIDPCDVPPRRLMLNVDLRQPFFLDDLLRGGSTTYDGRDIPLPEIESFPAQYREMLADTNRNAVESLLNDLAAAGKPVLAECWTQNRWQGIDYQMLKAWTPGMKLNLLEIDQTSRDIEVDGAVVPLLNSEVKGSESIWSRIFFGSIKDQQKSALALDALSALPSKLEAVLGNLFIGKK